MFLHVFSIYIYLLFSNYWFMWLFDSYCRLTFLQKAQIFNTFKHDRIKLFLIPCFLNIPRYSLEYHANAIVCKYDNYSVSWYISKYHCITMCIQLYRSMWVHFLCPYKGRKTSTHSSPQEKNGHWISHGARICVCACANVSVFISHCVYRCRFAFVWNKFPAFNI